MGMNAQMIRWGILGCGDVTEIKSGPALQRAMGSALVAVMRRDAAKAEDYARRHGVPRWYSQALDLIDDPEVDAIYVATPPDTHADYSLQVLSRGKPCYVEKPMARTFAECQRMVEGFAARRVPLFVAYYRRALPRFLKVRELLASGQLGALSSIQVRHASSAWQRDQTGSWRINARVSGGGLFLDLASHTLDLLDFLLGPLQGVKGHAARVTGAAPVEDTVALVFHTQAGVPGTGTWNFAAGVDEDVLEITGTRGRVSVSVYGGDPVKLVTSAGIQTFDLPTPRHIQQPLIQNVVNTLLGKDTPLSTGVSAARTSLVIDTVLHEYYGGREEGFWNRHWPGHAVTLDHSF